MSNSSLAGRNNRNGDYFASGHSKTHQGDRYSYGRIVNTTSNQGTIHIQAERVTLIQEQRLFGEVPASRETPPELLRPYVRPTGGRGMRVPQIDTSHPAVLARGRSHVPRSNISARTPQCASSLTDSPTSTAACSRSPSTSSPSRIPRLGTLRGRRFSSLSRESRSDRCFSSASSISTAATTPLHEGEEFFALPEPRPTREASMTSIDVALANSKRDSSDEPKSKQTPITAIQDCDRMPDMVPHLSLDKPLPKRPDVGEDVPCRGHPLESTIVKPDALLPQGADERSHRYVVAEKASRRRAVDLSDLKRLLTLAVGCVEQLESFDSLELLESQREAEDIGDVNSSILACGE